jgi:phage shock protein A
MGVFSKLFTALRGAANEAGEAVIDTQSMRILDQELRDAKNHLDEAKENLTKVIAQQIGADRKVKKLKKAISEHEGYAMQALESGNEALAVEISQKIADLENTLEAEQMVLDGFNNSVSTLKQTIRNTEKNIQSLEREINVIKTTEKVHQANEAAAARFSGSNSRLNSATESLERIKRKQQEKSDRMAAALAMQKEESGDDLQAKMRQAGIIGSESSGNSVLERLKAKKKKS